MPGITIRKMQPADAEAVLNLHLLAIRRTCAPHYTPEAITAWTTGLTAAGYVKNQAKGESFHVATLPTGQVIGFSGWKGHELTGLYLHPDFQGLGAGHQLLKAAEDEATALGSPITHIIATLNAMPFYRHHGYRVTTRSSRIRNGVRIPRYYMKKRPSPHQA